MLLINENKNINKSQRASFYNLIFSSDKRYFENSWRSHNKRIINMLKQYGFHSNELITSAWIIGTRLSPIYIRKHFGKEIADIIRIYNKSSDIIVTNYGSLILTIIVKLVNMEYCFNNGKKELFKLYQQGYKKWRKDYHINISNMNKMWDDLDYIMFNSWDKLLMCV